MRIKLIAESAVAGLLLYTGGNILSGMFLTAFYVPDIVDAYSNAGNLPDKVSFGTMPHYGYGILVWLGVSAVYYGIRMRFKHKSRK